jgi:hypothetical protein
MDESAGEPTSPVPGSDTRSQTVRVGVTGHMDLDPETTNLVTEALRTHLRELRPAQPEDMVGVSCLAPGADRIFARILLELGGRLEVIMPSGEYGAESADPDPDGGPALAELLQQAESVHPIDKPQARPQIYVAANDAMLASIDSLVAVWNGATSTKPGGTAHVVDTARSRSIPVTVIWPQGATRQG